MQSLQRLAVKSSLKADVISLMIQRLEHAASNVRCCALAVLQDVSPRGDAEVIRAVRRCGLDKDPDVRRMSINALQEIANKDDADIALSIVRHLKDPEGVVRKAAVDALPKFTKHNHADVNRNLVALSQHGELVVRECVRKVLRHMGLALMNPNNILFRQSAVEAC